MLSPKFMVMVSFCWKINFLPIKKKKKKKVRPKKKKRYRFIDEILEIKLSKSLHSFWATLYSTAASIL